MGDSGDISDALGEVWLAAHVRENFLQVCFVLANESGVVAIDDLATRDAPALSLQRLALYGDDDVCWLTAQRTDIKSRDH